MNNNSRATDFDLLLVENQESVIDIIKVLTKKFAIKIKFAKDTSEFTELIKIYNFKFVIVDLDLGYKLEGLFISTLYKNIRSIKNPSSKIYLLSDRGLSSPEIYKFHFDGIIKKRCTPMYEFLLSNFDFRSYTELLREKSYQELFFTV